MNIQLKIGHMVLQTLAKIGWLKAYKIKAVPPQMCYQPLFMPDYGMHIANVYEHTQFV